MKKTYTPPRSAFEALRNIYQLLGPSGDVGVSETPAIPTYPGGGD